MTVETATCSAATTTSTGTQRIGGHGISVVPHSHSDTGYWHDTGPPEERDWPSALLEFFWLFLLGPAIQLLGVAAFVVQAWRVKQGSDSALSVQGLAIQAVVFFLVGISFLYRYRIPPEELNEHFIVNLRSWYWRWGWTTINNVVFALAQGILAWLVSRRKGDDADERTALLSA